ncbi:hypothetical protein [Pontibacter kalidii]|nr:hypothetical protein [Pontibacter kalidii]
MAQPKCSSGEQQDRLIVIPLRLFGAWFKASLLPEVYQNNNKNTG